MNFILTLICSSVYLSELKRQLKAQKKAEEKAQKAVTSQQTPTKKDENAIGGENDEQDIDPNVRLIFLRKKIINQLSCIIKLGIL